MTISDVCLLVLSNYEDVELWQSDKLAKCKRIKRCGISHPIISLRCVN